MKLERKHFVAVGIGIVSIAAAVAYWQYKKLMNYILTFRTIKVNSVDANNVNIDLGLNLQNKSNVKYDILAIDYNVYINDSRISTATNNTPQTILPNSTSPISVNIKFNPSKAGNNLLSNVLTLRPTIVKVEVKLKVKLWKFTVNIPYTYSTTLKDLLTRRNKK